jgi:periplasmic divalent cation tolerance protein
MIIVLTTVPNEQEASELAGKIVGERLAACVQILPKMRSVYVWEGSVQREEEHLLLIKTLEERYAELEAFIVENHSYETPEIVAVPAGSVFGAYLNWVREEVRDADRS